MAGNGEIEFRITEHIGVLERNENGWTLECNMVAWNGRPEKVDIREWDPGHERMTRGITLTESQADNLMKCLGERYVEKHRKTPEKDAFER